MRGILRTEIRFSKDPPLSLSLIASSGGLQRFDAPGVIGDDARVFSGTGLFYAERHTLVSVFDLFFALNHAIHVVCIILTCVAANR